MYGFLLMRKKMSNIAWQQEAEIDSNYMKFLIILRSSKDYELWHTLHLAR